MLVLTRKPAETIHIGEGIVIKVIKTGKGTVKIGIEAPAHVRVMRGELLEDSEVGMPAPVIPASFGPTMRVVSDQYPHVA
jgi:carbon storage regulator